MSLDWAIKAHCEVSQVRLVNGRHIRIEGNNRRFSWCAAGDYVRLLNWDDPVENDLAETTHIAETAAGSFVA